MSRANADLLLGIAREASSVIRRVYQGAFSVDYKAPNDPVTAADREANELICRRLAQHFPGVPVVAEESDPSSFSGYRSAERIFFVDPLDGTREFVAKNDEFVVMIGLVDGDRPTLGVIHAPALDWSYVGVVGLGAWSIDPNGNEAPIAVSRVNELAQAKILVSRSHGTELLDDVVRLLGAREIAGLGSAGLKGAYVAAGSADGYVAPGYAGKRWDACAAEALVVAAGGRFTDTAGESIEYRAAGLANERGMVASNDLLHDRLLARLQRAQD